MGKILLTNKNVNEFIDQNERKIYIEPNMILAPGAKEVIRNKGLEIIYIKKTLNKISKEKENKSKTTEESMTALARKILKEKYNFENEDVQNKVISQVLKKLNY